MKRVALVGLLILFTVVAWQSGRRIYAGRQVSREVAEVQERVVSLQQENSELLKLLQYVKSPAFAEREARLRFGLAKPGEKEVVIVGPEVHASPFGVSSSPQNSVSNPKLWWQYFVGE